MKGLWRNLGLAGVLIAALANGREAAAQEVTLRLHHFLPPIAPAHADYFAPWAERVMEQSDGRIKVEIFPAMQLGGTPPALYDQVKDGVVDLAWVFPGYTPGRFPVLEVFDLPFMIASGEATSQAAWEFYDRNLRDRIDDVHVVMLHVHGPGLFHMKGVTVNGLEDLRGLTVRAPTRTMNRALELLGAEPIGMPITQIPEALSRGVMDGTVLPWEVTRPLRLAELVDSHTGFAGERGLYTASFIFAMNKDKYESLPDDLKAVIDDNSGIEEAAMMGRVMDAADAPARQIAVDRGNTIVMLEADERRRWAERMQPVVDEWIERVNELGLDGPALLQEARSLVDKYVEETRAE